MSSDLQRLERNEKGHRPRGTLRDKSILARRRSWRKEAIMANLDVPLPRHVVRLNGEPQPVGKYDESTKRRSKTVQEVDESGAPLWTVDVIVCDPDSPAKRGQYPVRWPSTERPELPVTGAELFPVLSCDGLRLELWGRNGFTLKADSVALAAKPQPKEQRNG